MPEDLVKFLTPNERGWEVGYTAYRRCLIRSSSSLIMCTVPFFGRLTRIVALVQQDYSTTMLLVIVNIPWFERENRRQK